jgi:hypothetical protein
MPCGFEKARVVGGWWYFRREGRLAFGRHRNALLAEQAGGADRDHCTHGRAAEDGGALPEQVSRQRYRCCHDWRGPLLGAAAHRQAVRPLSNGDEQRTRSDGRLGVSVAMRDWEVAAESK